MKNVSQKLEEIERQLKAAIEKSENLRKELRKLMIDKK